MKFNLPIFASLFFVLCFAQNLSSQERWLSGVIKDNNGIGLIGANVILKRNNTGVVTDFNGFYRIKCREGDTLTLSYTGFGQQEILVTTELFNNRKVRNLKTEKSKPILSTAYVQSIDKSIVKNDSIPSFNNQKNLKFDINKFRYTKNKIKKIKIENGEIKMKGKSSPIQYALSYNFHIASQFVKNSNLPEIQNEFAQGRSIENEILFRDQNDRETFSFGPKISTLSLSNKNGSIFKPSISHTHGIGIRTKYKQNNLNLNLNYGQHDDPYQINYSTDKHGSLYFFNRDFKSYISYTHINDQQASVNGNDSKILMHHLLTPSHFDNAMYYKNGNQNFSGGAYSNPYGIIKNDLAQNKNEIFTSGISYHIKSHNLIIDASLNYNQSNNEIHYNQTSNNSSANPYSYSKKISEQDINFRSELNWFLEKFNVNSNLQLNQGYLNYNLTEHTFNPDVQNLVSIVQKRKNSNLNYNVNITSKPSIIQYQLSNVIFISSLQNASLIQPRIGLDLDLAKLFNNGNNANYAFNFKTSASSYTKQLGMLYNNESHNSLSITSYALSFYQATADLFPDQRLDNEQVKKFSLGLNTSFKKFKYKFNIGYSQELHTNSIFPVLKEQTFELLNVANIKRHEIEASLSLNLSKTHYYNHHNIIFGIRKQTAKVTAIHSKKQIIPIAGFSNISNILKKGESPGAIFGTAWERTESDQILIDENGYPIKSSQLKIIGDPIPDLNIDFLYLYDKNNVSLKFIVEGQIGGQFWDGTEAVLDYHGRSKRSGDLRTQDLLFQGRLSNGTENQQTVAAYDPSFNVEENIFQRYGEIGISESYIKDASYLNLKMIEIGYRIDSNHNLFSSIDLKLYSQNLIQINAHKGRNPYSKFLSNTNISGLQFFNDPLQTEVGFKLILNL